MGLFKPEDFEGMCNAPPFSMSYQACNEIDKQQAVLVAHIANQILKERGQVFYGFGGDSDFWQRNKDHRYLQYHKALVVCIEPIKED